ncbi:MAG TPA: hypothetical protein GXZ48_07620 [Acholeplasmataceae bacterium]|nr:hypothetical protein [Acholeplasmataceae bacterium]
MLNIYDLYDIHAILINIRQNPEYELNKEVITKTINVLKNWQNNQKMNQIRTALQSISSLDIEAYNFVYVNNMYTYFPSYLKNENIYIMLIEALECLLIAIEEKNIEKIIDLADCLHNLPIYLVENHFFVPKEYWNCEVKYYRKKWDKNFLVKVQRHLKE